MFIYVLKREKASYNIDWIVSPPSCNITCTCEYMRIEFLKGIEIRYRCNKKFLVVTQVVTLVMVGMWMTFTLPYILLYDSHFPTMACFDVLFKNRTLQVIFIFFFKPQEAKAFLATGR